MQARAHSHTQTSVSSLTDPLEYKCKCALICKANADLSTKGDLSPLDYHSDQMLQPPGTSACKKKQKKNLGPHEYTKELTHESRAAQGSCNHSVSFQRPIKTQGSISVHHIQEKKNIHTSQKRISAHSKCNTLCQSGRT